jgi:hypothetical protein
MRLADCEHLYHASVGGYWQAVKSFGAMVLLMAVAFTMVPDSMIAYGAITCINMVLVYRTIQTGMRQRNQKVGICEEALLTRDWLYRIREIPWERIALVAEQASPRAKNAMRVLTILVANDEGQGRPVDIAHYAPTPFPETEDTCDAIRNEIIKRCRFGAGAVDGRRVPATQTVPPADADDPDDVA